MLARLCCVCQRPPALHMCFTAAHASAQPLLKAHRAVCLHDCAVCDSGLIALHMCFTAAHASAQPLLKARRAVC